MPLVRLDQPRRRFQISRTINDILMRENELKVSTPSPYCPGPWGHPDNGSC
jgi:hypothetical protein